MTQALMTDLARKSTALLSNKAKRLHEIKKK
jgi:hypothetical protein